MTFNNPSKPRSITFPLLLMCIALAALLASTGATAQEMPGKQKAATCMACHGQNGISPNELWPNIANQKQAYLVNQLQLFRSGARVNELMSPISKMLSDQDINDLAAYFAAGAP